jgi:beta-glucanase (GH16 family)
MIRLKYFFKGIWPALWLLQFECPAADPCITWPPEIDAIEARGDIPNKVTMADHFGR